MAEIPRPPRTDSGTTRRFHSAALEQAATRPTTIYVDDVFPNSFRFLIWLRFTRQFAPVTFFCVNYIIWLIIRLFAIIFGWCGFGNGKFASSATLRDFILQFVISIAVSDGKIDFTSVQSPDDTTDRRTQYTRRWRKSVWRTFWRLYAVLTYDLGQFIHDYQEAWKLLEKTDRELILFTDNGAGLSIPCSTFMDDEGLLQRIRIFYNLSRARGGLFEFLGTKSSLRVDIVKLVHTHVIGRRLDPPLDLGRYGPFSRMVHGLKNPSTMHDSHKLMERLGKEGVLTRLTNDGALTEPTDRKHGLNIVRAWDPYITSAIVIIPVLFSFIISIAWALVASAYYKVDISTSTQTGFTIGSYVVTAGALLIALVAFLDTKYVANDGVSSIKDETQQSGSSSSSSINESSIQIPPQQMVPSALPTPASTPAPASTPSPASTPAPVSTLTFVGPHVVPV